MTGASGTRRQVAADTRPAVTWWILALIVGAGACLRWYHLDAQSLWHDEAGSVLIARGPLRDLPGFFLGPGQSRPFELNPPLYFLLLHGWMAVVGAGELQSRLLSALLGTAALPLMFLQVEEMYDTRSGLYAAALLAVSQLGVMFSQEARAYELLVPLLLLTMRWFLRARASGRWRDWAACTVASILLMGTHYHAVLAVAAMALFTLLRWRTIPRGWLFFAAAAGVATLGPWVWMVLAAQVRVSTRSALNVYYSVWATTPLTLMNRFHNGAFNGLLNPAPHWSFPVGALLFGVPVGLMLLPVWRGVSDPERDATWFALLLVAVPVAGTIGAAALLHVQYDTRYAAFAIVPYYALAGAGLARLRPDRWSAALVCVTILYSLAALRANYTIPYKENDRDAIRFVDQRAAAGDCYVFVPFGTPPLAWSIYTSRTAAPLLTPASTADTVGRCARVWTLTYSRVEVGNEPEWRAWLGRATSGMQRTESASYFWMRADLFARTGGEPQRATR